MSDSLDSIKAKYQEVLARKIEEQAASMAIEIIGEYERTKDRFEKLQAVIDRLEAGENPKSVVEEYYNKQNTGLLGYSEETAKAYPMRDRY